jgi:hypothetical protein
MGNLGRYFTYHNLALALTLGSFASVATLPAQQPGWNLTPQDIATGVRLGKLLDHAKKNFEKCSVKSLIENMLDIKEEAESILGRKIDLDRSIDEVFAHVKNQGVKVDSNMQKEIRKIIKEKGKRYAHRSLYMEQCVIHDLEFDSLQEEALFFQNEAILFSARSSKSKDPEVVVPLKLAVGVTGALAGMFIVLVPLPIPGKMQVGTFLITTGVKYAADSIIEMAEERQKQGK